MVLSFHIITAERNHRASDTVCVLHTGTASYESRLPYRARSVNSAESQPSFTGYNITALLGKQQASLGDTVWTGAALLEED